MVQLQKNSNLSSLMTRTVENHMDSLLVRDSCSSESLMKALSHLVETLMHHQLLNGFKNHLSPYSLNSQKTILNQFSERRRMQSSFSEMHLMPIQTSQRSLEKLQSHWRIKSSLWYQEQLKEYNRDWLSLLALKPVNSQLSEPWTQMTTWRNSPSQETSRLLPWKLFPPSLMNSMQGNYNHSWRVKTFQLTTLLQSRSLLESNSKILSSTKLMMSLLSTMLHGVDIARNLPQSGTS